jgi:hypothetical protein
MRDRNQNVLCIACDIIDKEAEAEAAAATTTASTPIDVVPVTTAAQFSMQSPTRSANPLQAAPAPLSPMPTYDPFTQGLHTSENHVP